MAHSLILPTQENLNTLKLFFKAFAELSMLLLFISALGKALGEAYMRDAGSSIVLNALLTIVHAGAMLIIWAAALGIAFSLKGSWFDLYVGQKPHLLPLILLGGFSMGICAYMACLTRDEREGRRFNKHPLN